MGGKGFRRGRGGVGVGIEKHRNDLTSVATVIYNEGFKFQTLYQCGHCCRM